MTAQHDESAESEKRLRCESSAFWDEASDPPFSGFRIVLAMASQRV
jgi:hypothetical protein